jgi:AbrB family looped-hinge helix DNA binding protein
MIIRFLKGLVQLSRLALCEPVVRCYLTFMRTRISSKGQIVLPAELRSEDGIEPGQEFEVERVDRGEYLLRRLETSRNKDLVALLLACPVKDWFQRLERSQTTDDIPPLSAK